MNKLQSAEQLRRVLQMFAATLTDTQAMEVATVYDPWEVDKSYKAGTYLTHGTNGVGDPQLYKVLIDHKSQADWPPDVVTSLYDPIGLTPAGFPVWSQPSGAHDAYNIGDVVDHGGALYESLINGNVTVPGSDARYWKPYSA